MCKGVHCVDLGESFQTHIYLQILASIQPRTSTVKFAEVASVLKRRASREAAARGPQRPRPPPRRVTIAPVDIVAGKEPHAFVIMARRSSVILCVFLSATAKNESMHFIFRSF